VCRRPFVAMAHSADGAGERFKRHASGIDATSVILFARDCQATICWTTNVDVRLVHSARTEVNSSVNSRIGILVLRTNRAPTVLVSLQPMNTKYSRDQ